MLAKKKNYTSNLLTDADDVRVHTNDLKCHLASIVSHNHNVKDFLVN